jgi:hypothetical protein
VLLLGVKIEEIRFFLACITMARGEVHTGLRLRNLKDRGRLEGPGVDGSIMLKYAFKKKDGGMDCIDLAQERDWWWTLVNGVMNIRVPQNAGYFIISWGPVSFSGRTLLNEITKIIIIAIVTVVILDFLHDFLRFLYLNST